MCCRLAGTVADSDSMLPDDAREPVAIPITGELDLHTFRPEEISSLLENYFGECRRRGVYRVRVIHGKGRGTLRHSVLSLLRRSPLVLGFATGNETSGGWGATVVTLQPDNSC